MKGDTQNYKAADENSPAALLCLYPSKFSYSDIKQNSPNILPTVKRFKLLRLGTSVHNRPNTTA